MSNPKVVNIHISGPVASGKSVIAEKIKEVLTNEGLVVKEYISIDHTPEAEAFRKAHQKQIFKTLSENTVVILQETQIAR